MSDVKCARMLLDAAERDVAALRAMCHSEEISDEIFGFHVQQATEKLFKSWIAGPPLTAARFLLDTRRRTAGKSVLSHREFDIAVCLCW